MTDTLIDPQDKFYNDGFTEQRQEWPGLQRDMDPVPDSGEDSYAGTGRLTGRKSLITVGDSGIGRADVRGPMFCAKWSIVRFGWMPSMPSCNCVI